MVARGKLRIYLGAAPGVGKTYAMLDEGQRRSDRGTDVVVGLVETHERPHTQARLENLEVVPRRPVRYRDQDFEEMDLPAILARAPRLVLVDELAHTNVPGVENVKRWQDVEALLEAGIDVISTVNLQHLESVNDVVATITGSAQRETVPDSMVRRAEQIQLVDMTPEALRRRLAHGNIYSAERVDAALTNFFRPGNLAALRELALLWLADRVDDDLQAYRERHGIESPWETRERVVVAITGGDAAQHLIRRAARMASRTRAELIGVHVRRDDGLRAGTDAMLDESIALLEELSGRFIEAVGADVASALVDVARAQNATQLLIGAAPKSRVTTLVRGSIVARCVNLARGEFDVHVISTPLEEVSSVRSARRWRVPSSLSSRRLMMSLVMGVVAFPLVTLILIHTGRPSLALDSSIYLLVVIAVAAMGGLVPGLLGAIAGFLVVNWECTPPVHTFRIADAKDLFALLSYLAVALTISSFVDLAARKSAAATRAERDARALARLARHVVTGENALPEMVEEIVQIFELRGALIRRRDDPSVPIVLAGEVCETATVLRIGDEHDLVVDGRPLGPERQEILVAVIAQLVATLDRRQLTAEAAERDSLLKADTLRAALLAAVSHDLRTPLASIKTAATTLLVSSERIAPDDRRSLLEAIDAEADRLNELVGDLLDMARVQEGSVELVVSDVDLVELVHRATVEATRATEGALERVRVHSSSRVVVRSDPVLVERVAFNLITNALLHAPASDVLVDIGHGRDWVSIRVIDHGPGVAGESREMLFRPFQRQGDVANGRGVGLGLALAAGFAQVLGGELTVDDTPGGGCTMVLTIPAHLDHDAPTVGPT